MQAKELYEIAMEHASDENTQVRITGIMMQEASYFDKEFHKYLKEATDRETIDMETSVQ